MYQLDESAEKRILHKPCIDLERSEYTSFSMLIKSKCKFL